MLGTISRTTLAVATTLVLVTGAYLYGEARATIEAGRVQIETTDEIDSHWRSAVEKLHQERDERGARP